ncbi:MAG: GMC family oxidoreductase [Rhodanobacter sp.]
MTIDYLDGSAPADIEADICIVGAGPAGISMARAFIGTSVRVCLVESGGFAAEEINQQLCEGTSIGCPEFDPAISRLRIFGGTCKVWGGGCVPLSKSDFSQRHWIPYSGWPLSYADLEPHYDRARAFFQIEKHDFRDGSFLGDPSRPLIPFDVRKLVNQMFVSNRLHVGETYRGELERASNIRILLHANLVELKASPSGGSVREARIRSVGGRDGVVRARDYVLACGGIENARLLLLSNSVAPQGLGNDHDLVGRFFMDHPTGKLGTLVAKASHRVTRPYDRSRGEMLPEICLSDEVMAAHRLLNGRVRPLAMEGAVPMGIRALRGLRAAWRPSTLDEGSVLEQRIHAALTAKLRAELKCPSDDTFVMNSSVGVGSQWLQLGLGAGDIARALARKLSRKPTLKSDHVALMGYFEQAPNPDSRVLLGDDLDVLGQRKVCIDWQLTPLDRHSYRSAAMIFGTELAQACGGELRLEPWLSEGNDAVPQMRGTAHHMGTTRMADSPHDGVVDRHCRVHGIDNLHVAGSSVFPTAGWAFPTFTIVALSLRLAEHLRARLATSTSSVGP